MAEVLKDYLVDLNQDGQLTLDYGKNRDREAKSPDHRYGVAGFDGVRCTTNTVAQTDDDGSVRTMQRLEHRHLRALRQAGFDESVLGGAWR